MAQSSVTLFGVVDAAVSYQSATSRDAVTGASSKQSQWSLANSGYNASRLGFRSTEDIGGGLSASFWLDSAISNDDGSTGLGAFIRRSSSVSGSSGLRVTVSLPWLLQHDPRPHRRGRA